MVTSSEDDAVREFIARHARPYDPETDTYDRPPFASDIKEGKNDAIYNAHSYHTKVPPRSIIPYILHYTEPGDLILDPFCGTGMTGVAALMCADPPPDILEQFPDLKERVGQRRAILNDLAPAACHIAYNYTTPVDVGALRGEFERIKVAVGAAFSWLYGTEHYEPASGDYDPRLADVSRRLKNPPSGPGTLFEHHAEPSWELVSREEVEARLGYSVKNLPPGRNWRKVDVATADRWVAIPATIQYTVWSDVYRCEGLLTVEEPTGKLSTRGKNEGRPIVRKKRLLRGCGLPIVLWEVMQKDGHLSEDAELVCPGCQQAWSKVDLPWVEMIPVVCDVEFVGANGATRRGQRPITRLERERARDAAPERWGLWYPVHDIYPYRELMTMSANKRGVKTTADFYTRRNLSALALIWREIQLINETRTREFARFAFTAIIPYCCRKQNYGGGGGGMSGTLYLPSFHQEKNVWEVFERKVEKLLGDFGHWHIADACVVRKGAARDLHEIPDETIDYVFADPPFGGNIFYADASLMWESWLDQFTDEREESVYHRRSRQQREADGFVFKTLDDYRSDMESAFREAFRTLKPGRWATIEFNNSDGAVFEAIKDSIRAVGFEVANMLLLDKKQKTFKQVKGASGEDVVDKDVIINLRKPAGAATAVTAGEQDLEHLVLEIVRQHLRTLPERMRAEPQKYTDDYRTTSTLNSVLMNALLPNGVPLDSLSLPFIERVCGRYFRKVGQHWYLRGEAVGGATEEGLFEEEVSVRDEQTAISWLRQRLRSGPALVGELRAHWMRATGLLPQAVAETLVLEELLSDNFWRDPDTNRWREPTEEERERLSDDRALRVLHDAERFVEGSLKRHPTEEERAGWIDTLYRTAVEGGSTKEAALSHRRIEAHAAYSVIVRLFHSLPADRLDTKTFSRARKQAEVASRQLKKLVAAAGGNATTPAGNTLPLFRGESDDLK